ncbi:MAG TPA: hypothetical protein PKJ99_05155 [Thermoanaerobaculales bacterium]|nr:hypothetical protein [Thermoanaerobaculales bacterium]HQL31332.1 hypothetical protein [Thermoanaerobaculales bacterium]
MGPWLVDVQTRDELERWLSSNPPSTYRPVLMVVRGDSAVIREFLPNALDAAKLDDRRLVLWVKEESLIKEKERHDLFGDDDTIVAAVLDDGGAVATWVHADRLQVVDADFAFSTARG